MSPTNSQPEPESEFICVRCGYDLHGLSRDGPCPECGTPIDRSLGGQRLAAADPGWLARLALGQSLLAMGLYLAMLGLCLVPLVALLLFILMVAMNRLSISELSVTLIFVSLMGVVFIGTALGWIGAFLVTAQDPRESGVEPAHSARHLTRWGLAAPVLLIVVTIAAHWLPLSYTTLVLVRTALPLLAALGVTVVIAALLSCLAGRASRIPDQKLARRTYRIGLALRWTLPVFLGGFVLAFAPLRGAAAGLSWLVVVQALAALMGLLAGIVVMIQFARLSAILLLYRRAFRACRDEARIAATG